MPGHTDSHGGPNKPGPSGFGRDPDTKGGDGPNRQPGLFGSPGAAGSVGFTGTTVGAGPQFGGGGGQDPIPTVTDPVMSEALAAAAPEVVEETPQRTTNSIIEALFNRNLTFQYDPVADYVNRVYGNLRPDQRKRLLAKIGYEGEFDDFLDDFGQDIYDASNFQFSDLRNLFTPKPKAPPLTGQEIAGNVIGGAAEAALAGYTLPYVRPELATLTLNPIGMYLGFTQQEGPYQMDEDGNIIGDVANLQNAPSNYLKAVQAANVLTPESAFYETGVNFTPEQVAQISMGEQLRAEEQAATRGPSEVYQTPSFQKEIPKTIKPQPAAEGTDLQAIYNNLSSAEQDTVDTMMSFDEGYDLGYALRYVLGGNPLF